MNKPKLTELIDNFLENKLSEKDRSSFEKKLEIDSSLREELELQAIALEVLKIKRQDHYRSILQGYAKERKVKRIWINVSRIAAIFVLLVSAASVFYFEYSYSNDHLVASRFEPYKIEEKRNSEIDNGKNNREYILGLEAYYNEKYDRAIDHLSKIAGEDPEAIYMESIFYLGNAYLATGKYEEAINVFNTVINKFDFFDEEAQWYLSLSYLANGETIKSEAVLSDIVKENSGFKTSAEDLIEKLDSFWRIFSKNKKKKVTN